MKKMVLFTCRCTKDEYVVKIWTASSTSLKNVDILYLGATDSRWSDKSDNGVHLSSNECG